MKVILKIMWNTFLFTLGALLGAVIVISITSGIFFGGYYIAMFAVHSESLLLILILATIFSIFIVWLFFTLFGILAYVLDNRK